MNLSDIIDTIASQADDFLEGASNRAEARAGVNELINADFFDLSPAERQTVADGVMRILDDEGFFDTPAGGGPSDHDDAEGEES
jgi:hypothetical protein